MTKNSNEAEDAKESKEDAIDENQAYWTTKALEDRKITREKSSQIVN
jgi:hypothetical protein